MPQCEKKKLYIKTYGCQMNVYDSGRMADILAPLGYEATETPGDADMVILNTCHIREKAEEKVFSDLGRVRDVQKEGSLIAVAGCVAQASGAHILKRAPYVDIVLGPQTYHRLPEMVARAHRARAAKTGRGRGIVETDFPLEPKFDSLPETQKVEGSSAFLSVQEGCDKFCTFCVVPYTRGAEYSRPVRSILEEAKRLSDQGILELTLLGQNVNAYHGEGLQGTQPASLAQLMEILATQVPSLKRLRYMTSHPKDMSEDLIQAHGDLECLMPYLHLPIQSGSNPLLERMNRQHTAEFYLNILERLKKVRPDIALSSDFIVGFPGESDRDFEATLELVKEVGYAQAYSFKYSIRPGTPAGLFEDQVPEAMKDARLARLQEVILEGQRLFNQSCTGLTLPVLFDRMGKIPGQVVGKSPYLQSVHMQGDPSHLGKIVEVKILNGYANSLEGLEASSDPMQTES